MGDHQQDHTTALARRGLRVNDLTRGTDGAGRPDRGVGVAGVRRRNRVFTSPMRLFILEDGLTAWLDEQERSMGPGVCVPETRRTSRDLLIFVE